MAHLGKRLHFAHKAQPFGILVGRLTPETMVDPVDVQLWRFEPISGMGYSYSSEFAYRRPVNMRTASEKSGLHA